MSPLAGLLNGTTVAHFGWYTAAAAFVHLLLPHMNETSNQPPEGMLATSLRVLWCRDSPSLNVPDGDGAGRHGQVHVLQGHARALPERQENGARGQPRPCR